MLEYINSIEETDLICGYSDDICLVFSINSKGEIEKHGEFKADFKKEEPSLVVCKFSPSGKYLATAGEDSNLR